jgi:hypothetical protein
MTRPATGCRRGSLPAHVFPRRGARVSAIRNEIAEAICARLHAELGLSERAPLER